jgi:hypothetical protein
MSVPFPELEVFGSTHLQPNYRYFSGFGEEYAARFNM